MNRVIFLVAASVLFCGATVFAASSAAMVAAGITSSGPGESQQQADFKKAYASPEKDERQKAFALLEGAKQPASWSLIASALGYEPDNGVKVAGYTALSKMPAHDPALSAMLAQVFRGLKANDLETRLAYAKDMANSEFKYEVAQELAQYIWSKCLYPDTPTGDNNNNAGGGHGGPLGGGGSVGQPSADSVNKLRKNLTDFLAALNAIVKTDITADKAAPHKVKLWWEANSAKILATDKALVEKYRAEDAKK